MNRGLLTRRRFPVIGGGGRPFHYYVDSVNGNDANAGTSPSAAFATISALTGKVAAGTKIGLARGSSWREELNAAAFTGVTVAAYGTGAAPILNAADIVAADQWTKTGGLTNVYQASVTLATQYGEQWCNTWEDGANLTRAASAAACDAAAGSYFPTAEYGAITLYIHPAGSTDPTSNGKTYEVSARKYGLMTGDSSTVRGIETRNNQSASGSLVVGRSCNVYDCTARNGSKHNIYLKDGCYFENVTADGAYHTSSMSLFVFNENTPAGLGITFNNCTATSGAFIALAEGWYGHNNVSGTFGTVTWNNCAASNLGGGFDGYHAHLIFNNCTSYGCNYGFKETADTIVDINNCTITITANGTSPQGVGYEGSHLTMTGGLITDAVTRSGDIACKTSTNGASVVFDGVHIQKCTYVFYTTATGGTATFTNCDFETIARPYDTNLGGPTITSDYNRLREAGQDYRIQGTLYNDVASYRAATGQDANSTVG